MGGSFARKGFGPAVAVPARRLLEVALRMRIRAHHEARCIVAERHAGVGGLQPHFGAPAAGRSRSSSQALNQEAWHPQTIGKPMRMRAQGKELREEGICHLNEGHLKAIVCPASSHGNVGP